MTEISMVDLIHYMAFCGVLYDHAQDLLVEYCEAERSRGYWLSPHGQGLEDSICSQIYHESTAAESISYEPRVVPGLLQTEAYARAMIGRDQWRLLRMSSRACSFGAAADSAPAPRPVHLRPARARAAHHGGQ